MSNISTKWDCTWFNPKSSTKKATEGSSVTKIEILPVPLIPPATALKPGWVVKVRFGTNEPRFVTSLAKVFLKACSVIAETAIAASCCPISLFVPVTTISSISKRLLWAETFWE